MIDLDNLTLKQIKEIQHLLSPVNITPAKIENGENIKIVVLQRGWVVVGNYFQNNSYCWITNGFVIRRWGTSEGLGELAAKGPLNDTKLDKSPLIEFHELVVVKSVLCNKERWHEYCK